MKRTPSLRDWRLSNNIAFPHAKRAGLTNLAPPARLVPCVPLRSRSCWSFAPLFPCSFQESSEPSSESNLTSTRIDEDRGSRYSLAQIPHLVAITNPRPLKTARALGIVVARVFGSPSNSNGCRHPGGDSVSPARPRCRITTGRLIKRDITLPRYNPARYNPAANGILLPPAANLATLQSHPQTDRGGYINL